MRILVTGSSGLLGAQLVRLALRLEWQVYSAYNIHEPVQGVPIHMDLEELGSIEPLLRKVRPSIVVHAASLTDVDLCEEKPDMARLINGEATGKLAEAAFAVGSHMIYVSTDYVFDGKTGRYHEDDTPNPINRYGESKLLGERLLVESEVKHCIVRTSIVYGWGREHRPNFATWVIGKLESGQRTKVVGNYFASPTLNVNLAEMMLELAEKRVEGIFHLAGATRIDRYSFALRIAEAFRLDSGLIEQVSSKEIVWKAMRPADSSLDVSKAANVLQKKPLKLDQSLQQFIGEKKK